jgi:hypothetical protein
MDASVFKEKNQRLYECTYGKTENEGGGYSDELASGNELMNVSVLLTTERV